MKTKLKRSLHKALVFMLAFTMVFAMFGGSVAQAETNGELSRSFKDVSVNWSYKYISKLALLGVIQGRGNGNFAPNELVTQQEVLIMAVEMMGVTDEEIEQAKADVLPEELTVAPWAQGHVSMAIRKGLVDVSEEVEAVKSRAGETESAWGTWPASREWVAKMTIRAVGKEPQAKALAEQKVNFNDADQITKGFEGYINAAVQLDIVSGMPGNVFKPTDTVTRAQMAVFLSRGEKYMPKLSERVLIGTVVKLTDNELELRLADGDTVKLSLHSTAEFFSYAVNDAPIAASDVEPHFEVYVIHHNGEAYYIEVTNDEVHAQSVQGALQELNANHMEVVLLVDGAERSYPLSRSLSIVDQDGRGLSWSSLQKKSIVKLELIGEGSAAEVVQIVLIEAPVNKESTGWVESYDSVSNTFHLLDEVTGNSESYVLSEDVDIYYGERKLTVDELSSSDAIRYVVQDSVITEIELVAPVEPLLELVSGELRSPITDLITIINERGVPEAYVIAEDVTLKLSGLKNPTVSDIWIGDWVTLSVDVSTREVKMIEVQDRAIEQVSGAEIVSYHEESKSFFIWMPNVSQSHIFKLDANTVLDQQKDLTTDEIHEQYPPGTMVNIKYTGDRLIEVTRINGYVGVITEIDTTEQVITMFIEHYGEFEFAYNYVTSLESGKQDARLSDLRIGDRIEVHMRESNRFASRIILIYTDMYRLTEVNIARNYLTLTHPQGDRIEVNLSRSLRLTDSKGENVYLPDVVLNRPVVVSFYGEEIKGLWLAPYDRGQVKQLNPESFVYVNDGGDEVRVDLKNVRAIYRNGSNHEEAFEDLAVGDGIEISMDAEGKLWLIIMTKESKLFHEYDYVEKRVLFRRVTISEQNSFDTHPDLIVLEAGQPVSIGSLEDRDEVTVYFLDGKIVKIEKL